MLSHTTGKVDVDHGLGDGLELFYLRHFHRSTELEELGQSNAEAREGTDLDEVTTALTSKEVDVVSFTEGVEFHILWDEIGEWFTYG
jgi:hypothetical protein